MNETMACLNQKIQVSTFIIVLLSISSHAWGHTVWEQRNEPGPWTICLYHCDEEDSGEGHLIQNAGWNKDLNLIIGAPEEDGLESTSDVRHGFLNRALIGHSQQACVSLAEIKHPTGNLSIEVWLKFLAHGADIQIGFMNGISLQIRIGGDGDRFQLLGSNSTDKNETKYSAPGFQSFPPVGSWHHLGVTIRAPHVTQLSNNHYRYEDGCYAQFFYDSHIVGFVNQTKLDLTGLEFAPRSNTAILIHHGSMVFDEIMLSDVDWSDPVGHGGTGHGGVRVGHAFEDGRRPLTGIEDWSLF